MSATVHGFPRRASGRLVLRSLPRLVTVGLWMLLLAPLNAPIAEAADYVLVDSGSGEVIGPFLVADGEELRLDGRVFTIRRFEGELPIERVLAARVLEPGLLRGPVRDAIQDVLEELGAGRDPSMRVFLFPSENERLDAPVLLRRSFSHALDVLRYLAEFAGLDLLRDPSSDSLVLVSPRLAGDRTVRVYGMTTATYRSMTETGGGSLAGFLAPMGVVRDEDEMRVAFIPRSEGAWGDLILLAHGETIGRWKRAVFVLRTGSTEDELRPIPVNGDPGDDAGQPVAAGGIDRDGGEGEIPPGAEPGPAAELQPIAASISVVRFAHDGKLRLRVRTGTEPLHVLSYYPEVGDRGFLEYLRDAVPHRRNTRVVMRLEREVTFAELAGIVQYVSEMGFGGVALEGVEARHADWLRNR